MGVISPARGRHSGSINRLSPCGLNIPRHFRWRAPSVGAGNVSRIRRGLADSGGYLVSFSPPCAYVYHERRRWLLCVAGF